MSYVKQSIFQCIVNFIFPLKPNKAENSLAYFEMKTADIIGSLGVAILLFAFFLSIFKWIRQKSYVYLLLNVVGASLSAYASYLIDFLPFVILECTWAAVALAGVLKKFV